MQDQSSNQKPRSVSSPHNNNSIKSSDNTTCNNNNFQAPQQMTSQPISMRSSVSKE